MPIGDRSFDIGRPHVYHDIPDRSPDVPLPQLCRRQIEVVINQQMTQNVYHADGQEEEIDPRLDIRTHIPLGCRYVSHSVRRTVEDVLIIILEEPSHDHRD